MQQVLLQSATAYFITKRDGLLLQSATGITKRDDFITKCERTNGIFLKTLSRVVVRPRPHESWLRYTRFQKCQELRKMP